MYTILTNILGPFPLPEDQEPPTLSYLSSCSSRKQYIYIYPTEGQLLGWLEIYSFHLPYAQSHKEAEKDRVRWVDHHYLHEKDMIQEEEDAKHLREQEEYSYHQIQLIASGGDIEIIDGEYPNQKRRRRSFNYNRSLARLTSDDDDNDYEPPVLRP